jgi:hypothetical protein
MYFFPSVDSVNIGRFLMAKIGVFPLVGITGKRESAGDALCLAGAGRDAARYVTATE